MDKIRVFVVDDSPVARGMLIRMLSGEDDIEIVGEASTGQGSIIMLDEVKPDVIFLEALVGGGMSIVDIVREIKNMGPDIRIILCVEQKAMDMVRPVLNMGIADCVRKPYKQVEIVRAVRQSGISPE